MSVYVLRGRLFAVLFKYSIGVERKAPVGRELCVVCNG